MNDFEAHHEMVRGDPQVTWHKQALTLEENRAALTEEGAAGAKATLPREGMWRSITALRCGFGV